MENNLLEYYQQQLNINNIPKFLIKYLESSSIQRLKKIGYFCGMDYASKYIYNFSEYISRYDHSLTVALLTYKFTKNKKATLAGLFHDIATPCFSHVIDYMNNDYETQESTEEYTEEIIKNDNYLLECLKQDKIKPEEIIDFKKYTIVDNNRPKLCADRIDGVILTGIGWTKNITKEDIKNILDNLKIFINNEEEQELGFINKDIAQKVLEISESIDIYCHSKEDNYMMQLLSVLTRYAIEKNYIKYKDLYYKNEEEIINIFKKIKNNEFKEDFKKFNSIKLKEIPEIQLPRVKIRDLNPLVNNKRLKDIK